MCDTRLAWILPLSLFLANPVGVDGQILDDLREKVTEAKETLDDAREIRCEVEGVCGEVTAAPHFAPGSYMSLAVTFFDGSGRFRAEPVDGLVRSIVEGQLLENGFLMAASSDVSAVQERIARGEGEWSDDDLLQLQDFIQGIDAVVVAQIDRVDLGRCELDPGTPGTEATVHLSLRWLNVDAGDIPWIARHAATVCEDGGMQALTASLNRTTEQLAGMLPVYP